MLQPNNLEYFYEEKETSERVFDLHRKLHLLWKAATLFTIGFVIWAFERAHRQNKAMWNAAGNVV